MARTVQPYLNMRTRSRRSGQAGFSLIEMLIVVVMIGLMSLFAFPRVVRVFDQSQVRSARQAVQNKFNTARMNARQFGRRTFLIRNGNWFVVERTPRMVELVGSDRDTVGSMINVRNDNWQVAAEGADTVAIDPRGLTQGAGPWVFTFVRNAARDSIIISGFGMVTR